MSNLPVVEDISLAELKQGLAQGSILLVDCREDYEWVEARIPGAVFNPLSKFDVAALPQAAGKKVVIHCRSGRRSITALEMAQSQGRPDITTHFGGGMLAWQAAGEPTERG
ncbi:MAG: rhodanese-like domain-containing protein [Alphaproteobacteria bacterium]|nr:rhodanese-like domain-containing protein [Alphaproteobacteria bacterium]